MKIKKNEESASHNFLKAIITIFFKSKWLERFIALRTNALKFLSDSDLPFEFGFWVLDTRIFMHNIIWMI